MLVMTRRRVPEPQECEEMSRLSPPLPHAVTHSRKSQPTAATPTADTSCLPHSLRRSPGAHRPPHETATARISISPGVKEVKEPRILILAITGGRTLDPFRSSLTPKMVQALLCTQDWLRAKEVPIVDVEENLKELEEIEKEVQRGESNDVDDEVVFVDSLV
uniref:HAT C-terminal dimerisation domain-containing protein n=1 Tax=Chenopodium quinoa TaxID=63459 RepID=A0A803MKJ5_CHEQI